MLSFAVVEIGLPDEINAVLIGGLVFGIPEVLMIAAIAVMGREAWDVIKNYLHGILTFISPQKVGKQRYYIGVVLFSLCLIEGVFELHTALIQEWIGPNIGVFHWTMNILFVLSFFIAGGDFWDKLRKLFVYDS